MPKVASWSNDDAKKILRKRLEGAKKYRALSEQQMLNNYRVVNNAVNSSNEAISISFSAAIDLPSVVEDQADSEIGTNLIFKYLRFIHSQMSANPPSVAAKATTTDPEDRRKADAADRIARHLQRVLDLQEVVDQQTLQTLTYCIGWIKGVWNPDKGEVSQFDESTNEIVMSGDLEVYSPDSGDVWVDPDARALTDIKYIFECIRMSLEEAIFLFPEYKEKLKSIVDSRRRGMTPGANSEAEEQVEIYEYYEKGAPVNGMAGRFVRFIEDYTILGKVERNRHAGARLPYHPITYVDVPNQLYGKSVVEYAAPLQDMMNRIDSSIVDNVQSHGVTRLMVPEGTEIEDEALSDSAWDWIKYRGNMPPTYLNPPALMSDVWSSRTQAANGIQELFSVNDSQLGIQKREQSAVSQQTAIEQGTLIHRRLFKKYERCMNNLYKDLLELVRENWTLPRTVQVIGKENAFEATDFKGADIDGGFDLKVEYGANLPLDPNLRRESIMLLAPMLKEAGMSSKAILQYMKLNDLEGIYDRMELAAERQREVFEEMIAKVGKGIPPERAYIPPHELEEHAGRLEFAYTWLETTEFKYLQEPLKDMIRMHVKEREAMMAEAAQQAPATDPALELAGMPGVDGAMDPSVGRKAGGTTGPVPGEQPLL